MDLLKVEPDSCDDSEVVDIKVEEVTIKEEDVTIKEEDFTVVKEEEDPLLIRVPLTGAEHEVSCILQMSRSAMSVSLPLHKEEIPYWSQDFAGRLACSVCMQLHDEDFLATKCQIS